MRKGAAWGAAPLYVQWTKRYLPLTRSRTDRARQPTHPALPRPSSMWAWSSGRSPGWRSRTYPRTQLSNPAGAIAMAFSSASFASAVRPIWPSAAASIG